MRRMWKNRLEREKLNSYLRIELLKNNTDYGSRKWIMLLGKERKIKNSSKLTK